MDTTHFDEPVKRLRVNGRSAIVKARSMNALQRAIRSMNALQRAIDKAGGPSAFAKRLGISRQALWKWKRVPADRIIQIERLTGVPREELRPDLYRPRKR
jgi:hypothetical protein